MNMIHNYDMHHAWPSEYHYSGREYVFTIHVELDDATLLWRTAAAHLLSCGTQSEEEVEELIGPRADPSIADCLCLLLGPQDLPGVRYKAFRQRG